MADQATETSVFGETPAVTASTPEVNMSEPAVVSPHAAQLAGIMNEGGQQKYSNVEAALASIPHASKHIADLEDEAKVLRDELAKRQTAEEIVSMINPGQTETVAPATPANVGLNEARVSELVSAQIVKTEAIAVSNRNTDEVRDTLVAHFGDAAKAEAAYLKAAEDAGIGKTFLDSIAARSPTALFKFMNLDATQAALPGKQTEDTVGIPTLSTNIQSAPAKSMMYGASTKELVDEWRTIGKELEAQRQ